jgi:hypothetical protein
VTFFERYFEALDGPAPHNSLELVSLDVEFSILWAAGRCPSILHALDPSVLTGTSQSPRLIGSCCERRGTVTFRRQAPCPRYTSVDVRERRPAARHAVDVDDPVL